MKIIKRICLSIGFGALFFFAYLLTLFTGLSVFDVDIRQHKYDWLFYPLVIGFGIVMYVVPLKPVLSMAWVRANMNVLLFVVILGSIITILIYSLIAFLILTLISKLRRPKQEFAVPPLPPERFD